MPLRIDKDFIKTMSKDCVIISGRVNKHNKIIEIFKKFGIINIHLRPNHKISETEFKINKCKELKVTTYYDDRKYIVKRLKANGIDARDINE